MTKSCKTQLNGPALLLAMAVRHRCLMRQEKRRRMKRLKLHLNFTQDVNFAGEFVRANPITEDTAEIATIPVTTKDLSRGDIVEFDPQTLEIVEVVERKRQTFFGETDRDFATQKWNQDIHGLEKKGILVEIFGPRLVLLAVPLKMDVDNLVEITADIEITLLSPKSGATK
jgi:hypothetical protein